MIGLLGIFFASIGVYAEENEAKYLFTAYPAGYELKNGQKEDLSIVEADGKKALQFKSADITYVRIRSPFQALKPSTKYIVTFQARISDLKTEKGKWPDGIRLEIRPKGGKPYKWIMITGNGTVDGWITAVLPFDTTTIPELVNARISLYFFNMSGTVLVRNLKIKAVDAAVFPKGQCFKVGEDIVHNAVLKL